MIDNNIEIRQIEVRQVAELRALDPNSRKIGGTAIVFNSLSQDLGGFKEIIKPEAITQELIDNSDIVMLFNHNQDSGVLARSKNGKGSLKIILTSTGVDFEFDAKKTALGDEVLESVRQGDLSACSFAFRIAQCGDSWLKNSDDSYLRTINNIELLKDLSIVVDPAYSATSIDMRSLDEFKAMEDMNDLVAPMDSPDATEMNNEDINKCDMCQKCELMDAKIDKVLELVQKMVVEDMAEDLAETLEPVCEEQPEPEESEPMNEDACEMEQREIDEYYNQLRKSIKNINIK